MSRCGHEVIHCVHGDEINFRNGARIKCADCGRSLRGPLPEACTANGAHSAHRLARGMQS